MICIGKTKCTSEKGLLTHSDEFSTLLQTHVFTSRFDWFTGLSVSFVIVQSDFDSLVLDLRHPTETHSILMLGNKARD